MATHHVTRERAALVGLALAQLMTSLDTSMVNASLPRLAAAYDVPFHRAQWIVLAYLLAVTSFTVSAGRLGDAIGRRRLLLAALAIFAAASLACAAAPTFPWLIAARLVLGISAGTIVALTVAMVGDVANTPGAQGRAMGHMAAMSAIGTTIGPLVAGAVSGAAPGAVFLVDVLLGGLTLMSVLRFVPPASVPTTSPLAFDVLGAVLLALTLSAYALAMTPPGAASMSVTAVLIVAALGVGVAFTFVEANTSSPLLPLALFRDRALVVGLVTSALVATVVMATLIVGPFYLSKGLALGAHQMSLVLSAGPAAAALTATMAGRLVARVGTSMTIVGGLAAMAMGSVALATLPAGLGAGGYVVPLLVLTAGYAAFQTGNNTAVLAAAGHERRGVVGGLLTLSRNLGLITGASAMGAVFVHAVGVSDMAAAQAGAVAAGMRTTMSVAAGLILSALVATAAIAARQSGPRIATPVRTVLATTSTVSSPRIPRSPQGAP